MVNLLPWREIRREQNRRRFLLVAACCLAAACAVLFALYRGLEASIAAHTTGITQLQVEIARLGARGAEADRLQREQALIVLHMEVLQELQQSRPLAAEILAGLADSLPAAAVYRRLERVGNHVEVEGEAESHAAIAELMRNLAASPLFLAVELSGATDAASSGPGRLAFSLLLPLAASGVTP